MIRSALALGLLLLAVHQVRRTFLRPPSLPHVERPGGQQRPLTVPVTVESSQGCPGFQVDLPFAPHSVGPTPTPFASTTMLMAPLGGKRLELLMVEVLDPGGLSPQAALDAAGRKWRRRGARVSPSRETTFAGLPAVSMDVGLAWGKVEREYRFLKDGVMFSVGLVCKTSSLSPSTQPSLSSTAGSGQMHWRKRRGSWVNLDAGACSVIQHTQTASCFTSTPRWRMTEPLQPVLCHSEGLVTRL